MTLLLMAGGFGSRYGKLKQFDGFGPKQEFLMEFSMHDAISNGFTKVVVVTHADSVDKIYDYLREKLPTNIALEVVPQLLTDVPEGSTYNSERQKPWGTAQAVWAARKVINEPFAVINADDYYGQQAFTESAAFFNNSKDDANFAIVSYQLDETLSDYGTVSRGVCQSKEGKLNKVEERLKLAPFNGQVKDEADGTLFTGKEPVSMNFWLCKPAIFEEITNSFKEFLSSEASEGKGEIYLPSMIQNMLDKKQITVDLVPSKSNWFGVTYVADRDVAVNALQEATDKKLYPSPLW